MNLPDYFGPGEYGAEYAGDPALVARTVGVDVADVAPYFRQVSLRRACSKFRPPPKAHAADKYHLLGGWVITDLWERMGIAWLGGEDVPYARLTMDHDACQALHAYLS